MDQVKYTHIKTSVKNQNKIDEIQKQQAREPGDSEVGKPVQFLAVVRRHLKDRLAQLSGARALREHVERVDRDASADRWHDG